MPPQVFMLVSRGDRGALRSRSNEVFRAFGYQQKCEDGLGFWGSESLRGYIMRNVEVKGFSEGNLDVMWRFLRVQDEFKLFRLLHSLLAENPPESVMSNLTNLLAVMLDRSDISTFGEDIVMFYIEKLWDGSDIGPIASILAVFYSRSQLARELIQSNCVPDFVFSHEEIEIFSPLWDAFAGSVTGEETSWFAQRIIALLDSNLVRVQVHVLHAFVRLLENGLNPDFLTCKLNLIQSFLYSEIVEVMSSALRLLILLNCPPVKHLEMILTLLSSGESKLCFKAINILKKFAPVFVENGARDKVVGALMDSIREGSFRVARKSLSAVLIYPLSAIEKVTVGGYLLEYSCDEVCLSLFLELISDSSDERQKLVAVIGEHESSLEDIVFGDDMRMGELAERILTFLHVD
jgi:hypothetical protein